MPRKRGQTNRRTAVVTNGVQSALTTYVIGCQGLWWAGRGQRRRGLTFTFVLSEDSSSESGSGNGLPALTPPSSAVTDGSVVRESEVVNGNSGPAPLDFSTPSSSSSSEDQQPMNLSEPPPRRLPFPTSHLPVTVSAAAAALLGALHPSAPEELRRKYPLAAKPHTQTHSAHAPNMQPHVHAAELCLDRDGRDYRSKVRPTI